MGSGRAFLAVVQLFLVCLRPAISLAPQDFPASGNGLWYNQPANSTWAREWLPIGNGYLAAMVPGGTVQEATQLNIESLWSGGPFADTAYNGGNKKPTERDFMAQEMQRIRQSIFQNQTGLIDNIEVLGVEFGQYGSYAGAGHLLSSLGVHGAVSNYKRWLDLDHGLARTSWTQNNTDFLRTTFCSHPIRACVQHITAKKAMPDLTYAFTSILEPGLPAPNITCKSQNSLLVSGHVSSLGMAYAFVFRVFSSTPGAQILCVQFPVPNGAPFNATLQVSYPPNSTPVTNDAWIAWVGDTDYDIDAGVASKNYSFRGVDPVDKLLSSLSASTQSLSNYDALLVEHVADIQSTLYSPFSLDLGQTPVFDASTDVLKSRYAVDDPESNTYLEWLLFNYGRYLLASSARGVLPSNLQGKWGDRAENPWGADYHSNINIQMNYWSAEMTGLSSLTSSLFSYIEKTWAPRGAETAQVLYNISRGWVTHNEMNIFGHTGMKGSGNSAEWANYPEANVWMMIHVWDHFDHTNDVQWWKTQGWPLVKGVASFHLEKLIPDLRFNDSSLVVSPCNSPEQEPITFGCAHAQQMIWQLFNAVEKGFESSGDTDTAFLEEVRDKRARMDKGLKIGSWGQLQEWKVEKDSEEDRHRHLSHLVGLYPGYAISKFDPSPSVQGTGHASPYTKSEVLTAAQVSLDHRGNGTGPDANSGWEKVWRAAAWAQLGDSSRYYHILSFAVAENFGANLFSLYDSSDPDPIFQIDANLGYPAAVMNALIQAPDVPNFETPLVITLLPALPSNWQQGSIRGARVRGGITVDMRWDRSKLIAVSLTVDPGANPKGRTVKVVSDGGILTSFLSVPGLNKKLVL